MRNMRSMWGTIRARISESITPSQLRNSLVIFATILAVGISYGAISQGAGFPLWQTALLAAVACGGAAELTFVGVIAAGGSPLLAALGGLLVNTRNFAFGLSVGEFAPPGWRRYLGAHLINDETTAFSRAVSGKRGRWQNFVLMAVLLYPAWVGGAVIGQLLGAIIDADALGVDAAFPVILFCLVVGDLRKPLLGITAAGGAVLAFAATPVLPLGLGAVAALVALLPAAGYLAVRKQIKRTEPRALSSSRISGDPAARPDREKTWHGGEKTQEAGSAVGPADAEGVDGHLGAGRPADTRSEADTHSEQGPHAPTGTREAWES